MIYVYLQRKYVCAATKSYISCQVDSQIRRLFSLLAESILLRRNAGQLSELFCIVALMGKSTILSNLRNGVIGSF